MEVYPNRYVYNADDEMPDCLKCDFCGGHTTCEKQCGAEHGWWGYRRTEYRKHIDGKEIKNIIFDELGE